MTLRKTLSGLLILTAQSACVAASPAAAPVATGCGAGRLDGFVGEPVAALDEQYLPQVVRILRPGVPVTEDYSPSRLNVDVDRAGRITAFWCG